MPSPLNRLVGPSLRVLAALGLWGLAAGSASAQALGRPEGELQLGRPLRISVPLQVDPADESPCIQASLQQGDTAPTPLQWTLEAAGDRWRIRLRSAESVQEPVITVSIAVGCGQQFTRGYVLLAELPRATEASQAVAGVASEPAAAARRSLTVVPAGEPAGAAPAALRAETRLGPPPVTRPAEPVAEVPAAAALPMPVVPERAPGVERPAAASVPAAPPARTIPRLRLELFDAQVDQAPVLKLTLALAKPPAAEDPRRAEAAALRQATLQTPEAAAAQALQAPVRQAQAQNLRELQGRQDKASDILSESLARAVAQRDQMLAIAAVLALGLGALVWLGRRSRRRAQGLGASEAVAVAPEAQAVAAPAPRQTAAPVRAPSEATSAIAAMAIPHAGPAASAPAASADELLDIQQKADFFIAVGRMDEAVALMEAQLDEPMGGMPYVWLDLLDMCRRMERPDDYERIRDRFQRRFSAHVPAFHAARTDSGGLERYPRVLSRIQVLWPSAKALDVIETALFEGPAPGAIPFDLQATRDLLLLYGVLLEMLSEAQAQAQSHGDFTATVEAPLLGRVKLSNTEPIPLSVLAALDEGEGDGKDRPEEDPLHELDLDFSLSTVPARAGGQVHA